MPDADPFNDLPSLDLDAEPFYEEPVEARNAGAGLEDDLKLIRKAERRRLINDLHVANSARTLDRLPEHDETFHIIVKGNWPAWALVPATLQLAAPATIKRLDIATLGFSRDNGQELLSLMDSGEIEQSRLVCSCYFKSNDDGLFAWIAHELQRRNCKAVAVRNHAKIITMELSDGRGIVVESSANLRSCRNVEQFTICESMELLRFHRGWIEEVSK